MNHADSEDIKTFVKFLWNSILKFVLNLWNCVFYFFVLVIFTYKIRLLFWIRLNSPNFNPAVSNFWPVLSQNFWPCYCASFGLREKLPFTSYITSLHLYGSMQQLGKTTVKLSLVTPDGSGDEISIVGCPDTFGMCLILYFLFPEINFISASPAWHLKLNLKSQGLLRVKLKRT